MTPAEKKDMEKQVDQLRQNIRELNSELETLNIVLKGSKALDIVGVFERLKESEKNNVEFKKMYYDQLSSIQENINLKFDIMQKDIDLKFHDMISFRIKIETYVNMISSKVFWRAALALFVLGALLIAWGKGGYELVIKLIKQITN